MCSQFGCCGVNTYWDYKEFTYKYNKQNSANAYPLSCCNNTQTQSSPQTCSGPSVAPPVPNPSKYSNFQLEVCSLLKCTCFAEY